MFESRYKECGYTSEPTTRDRSYALLLQVAGTWQCLCFALHASDSDAEGEKHIVDVMPSVSGLNHGYRASEAALLCAKLSFGIITVNELILVRKKQKISGIFVQIKMIRNCIERIEMNIRKSKSPCYACSGN